MINQTKVSDDPTRTFNGQAECGEKAKKINSNLINCPLKSNKSIKLCNRNAGEGGENIYIARQYDVNQSNPFSSPFLHKGLLTFWDVAVCFNPPSIPNLPNTHKGEITSQVPGTPTKRLYQ